MAYFKKLGIFVKIPREGRVKTRLVPPLSEEEAAELSLAFFRDFVGRLAKLKKIAVTVFYDGDDDEAIRAYVPGNFDLVPQTGDSLGEKLLNAFKILLAQDGCVGVVVGTDSPDLPLKYIKRAYQKLKHKDLVLGPCADGGYYMIGMKSPHEELFDGISWGESAVLKETLEKTEALGLSLSLFPLWYDVDEVDTLRLLRVMMYAKRLEKSGRLMETEKVLQKIADRKGVL
jgi:hypothetical protein